MTDDAGRLRDILEAIEKIEKHTAEGRKAFDDHELIQVWVVHHLQIIGEAASRLSPKIRSDHPEVPWSQMIGMRHVLVHDYGGIDPEVVWAAVERALPTLKPEIDSMLRDLGGVQ